MSLQNEMRVTKRNGELETIEFDKILKRIKIAGEEVNLKINYTALVMKVIDQLFDTISTIKIDELSAEQCASMSSVHPDYNILAGRIIVSNHQKNTSESFSKVMIQMYEYLDKHNKSSPLVSEELYRIVLEHRDELDNLCDYSRDFLIDYFGFKTLERAYLMKINGKSVERPQHMWLRVAVGIHGDNMEKVKKTYNLMSQKYFTHATPTLFNAGTPRPQLSSCFLISMESDSVEGIYNTLKDCARISKWAGGIGLHIHNVRASGSHIRGTNGSSNGIVPMLRVFNNTAKYIDQGGGRRNGSFAIYLEPWHADIEMFLQMRKNHGDEELKARDLFYALWVPDLFMERVKTNGKWTLMCPDECPGLSDVYGDEFVALYTKYEESNAGRVTLNARDLWFQILDAQMETGTPYLLFKDAVNRKSNQKNVGVIKSSNLCVAPETRILTDKGHLEIKSLDGSRVNVWNGKEFSEVLICKTGTNQELMEVHTNDGCSLTCTKYHKFYIQGKNGNVIVRAANDLNIDDTIIHCEFPAIDGNEIVISPYTQGVYSSDYGYLKNRYQKCIMLSKEKAFLKDYIDYSRTHTFFSEYENDRNILYLHDYLKPDNYIPFNARLRDKLEWFAGLIDIDGKTNESNELLLIKASQKFLLKIKLMLQTCGVNSRIVDISNIHEYKITKEYYQLIISNCDANKLISLGFNSRVFNKIIVSKKMDNLKECQFFYCKIRSNSELDLSIHKGSQRSRGNSESSTAMYEPILDRKIITSSNHFQVKISKIVKNGRHDDTFCFTEPKRNTGIFNGMLTSQCTEITEYSDENETAVCNLASIALPTFMDMTTEPPTLNYEKLHEVTKVITENLNCIIDVNYYPTEKTRRSNMRHRPIGIGVQGLADVFMMMNIPFVSEQSSTLNKHIFETIYHAALERSCELAEEQGKYETFDGSPTSEGILQFDLWEVDPTNERYDWTALKQKIQKVGLRNSLLLAPMPTASTSQILGFNECIEPITSNIYNRRTIAGEFILTNKYLMYDLLKIDQWNEKTKNSIVANNGSIQHIDTIPQEIRDKYKTVWEIPMRALIDMAADRGAYICQSQSLNLWQEDPNYNSLTSMHFYSWSKGLKTGIYYLRRRAKHQAQQFTIEPDTKRNEDVDEEDEICDMCSS